jgi:hypothetical protein
VYGGLVEAGLPVIAHQRAAPEGGGQCDAKKTDRTDAQTTEPQNQ